MGTELTVQHIPTPDPNVIDPMSHFINTMNEILEYALYDRDDTEMIDLTITNEQNVGDKAVGISFRRKDQLSAEAIWAVFEKVMQTNTRFNALDRLNIQIHAVRMSNGSGRVKAKGRPLSVMAHLKKVLSR
jgi:hypothetical protein